MGGRPKCSVLCLVTSVVTGYLLVFVVLVTMADQNQPALEKIAKSSRLFSTKLFEILGKEPGNVFFSPTSVEVVLALAQFGARGNTAQQILDGLELPSDVGTVKDGYNALMTKLKSTDDMILEIANKVYSESTFPVEEDFTLVAQKSFLAAAENVDFKGKSEESRQIINGWVEEQTRSKIQNLLPPGIVNSDTRLVLVNAVYFKGKWKYPFDPMMTKKQPFYITPSDTKLVDMMHIKKKFGYSEIDELQAKMLVMPYMGDKMHMVILLPFAVDGLPALEEKLQSVDIVDLMRKTDHLEVEVSLPKFKIEKSIDLNEPLKQLGMVDMFDACKADFSGISKQEGLYVSQVIQKAFIEVNEEGSEAAAATGMVMMLASVFYYEPTVFKADHPFVYFLVNDDVWWTLFQGKITSL